MNCIKKLSIPFQFKIWILNNKNLLFLVSILVFIPFLYSPIVWNKNISYLALITTNINLSGNPFLFAFFNEFTFSYELVFEAPGFIWIQSIINLFIGSNVLSLMIFWLLFSLISIYYFCKLTPFFWDLQLENVLHKEKFFYLAFYSVLLIPIVFKQLFYDFLFTFIFFNTVFLFYFCSCLKSACEYDFKAMKKYFNISFVILGVFFFLFGLKSLFALLIGLIYFIIFYHKNSHGNSKNFLENEIFKVLMIQSIIISLILLYLAFFSTISFIFFMIFFFVSYFISLILIDNLLTSHSPDQTENISEINKELKKLVRRLHIGIFFIGICISLLLIWFSFFSLIKFSSFNYNYDIFAFLANLDNISYLIFLFVIIFILLGIFMILKFKEIYVATLYLLIETLSVFYLLLNPFSLFTTILVIFIIPILISFEGFFYSFKFKQEVLFLKSFYEKYFWGLFFSIKMVIFLLILNLDELFINKDITIFINIIYLFLLLLLIDLLISKLFVESLIDSILVFLSSFFFSSFMLNLKLIGDFNLSNLFSFFLMILLTIIIFYSTKPNIKILQSIFIAMILVLPSLTFNLSIVDSTKDVEDVTNLMKDIGVTNSSYWVFPSVETRNIMIYLLKGNLPVNYGNYENYPFNSNSSSDIINYFKNNQVKYIFVNFTYLEENRLFEPIIWLMDNYQSFHVNIGENTRFSNKYIFYF
jgi:hypothetical protein